MELVAGGAEVVTDFTDNTSSTCCECRCISDGTCRLIFRLFSILILIANWLTDWLQYEEFKTHLDCAQEIVVTSTGSTASGVYFITIIVVSVISVMGFMWSVGDMCNVAFCKNSEVRPHDWNSNPSNLVAVSHGGQDNEMLVRRIPKEQEGTLCRKYLMLFFLTLDCLEDVAVTICIQLLGEENNCADFLISLTNMISLATTILSVLIRWHFIVYMLYKVASDKSFFGYCDSYCLRIFVPLLLTAMSMYCVIEITVIIIDMKVLLKTDKAWFYCAFTVLATTCVMIFETILLAMYCVACNASDAPLVTSEA